MKHKHAELMMEYAKDALESDTPWRNWEFCSEDDSSWTPLYANPGWYDNYLYRRKRKTKLLNGFEVAYPETEKPSFGTTYYVPCVGNTETLYGCYRWCDDSIDNGFLSNGLVYLSQEDAEVRAKSFFNQFKE